MSDCVVEKTRAAFPTVRLQLKPISFADKLPDISSWTGDPNPIPAICLFIFAYMRWGFGEPWTGSLGYAAATTLVCWVVFDWALIVAWPRSLLGDMLPMLRTATGLI